MQTHAEPVKHNTTGSKPKPHLSEAVLKKLSEHPTSSTPLMPMEYGEVMRRFNVAKPREAWFAAHSHIDLEKIARENKAAKEAAEWGVPAGGDGAQAASFGEYGPYKGIMKDLLDMHKRRVKTFLAKREPVMVRIMQDGELGLAMPSGPVLALGKGRFFLKGDKVIVDTEHHGQIVLKTKVRPPLGH